MHADPQPLSQQTPSTQMPAEHWWFPLHAWPIPFFGMHTDDSQNAPDWQSASAAHVASHPVLALQLNAPQPSGVPATQALSRHVELGWKPSAWQDEGSHVVPFA